MLQVDPKPITWNVIGLDSNAVNAGPNRFPVGVRVWNTGTSAATSVTAVLNLTGGTGAAYVSLADNASVTTPSLAPGAFTDFFYIVQVKRDAAAYSKTRDYRIDISSASTGTTITATGQLYVEKLVSQARNAVLDLMGPDTITRGEIRHFVLTATTAPNGYPQLTTFVDFPNDIFRILKVQAFYSAGGTNDKVYADACGWDANPASPTYLDCIGPQSFASGKAGGTSITVHFDVEVLRDISEPVPLCPLILDQSGSSFHYNSDFGTLIETVKPRYADIAVVKSDTRDPVEPGSDFEYLLTVLNMGEVAAGDVVLRDTLPAGITYLGATPPPDSGPNPLVWNLGTLETSGSRNLIVQVRAECDGNGTVVNTASVATSTSETALANNQTSEPTQIIDILAPRLECNADAETTAAECESTATLSLDPPVATDDCTPGSIIATGARSDHLPLTDPYPVGETLVTWTASDTSGNVTTCSCKVTVHPSECNGCTLTQGFWKNHPEEWPVTSLTLGTRSYTQAELLSILNEPVAMNGLVLLARQLIAAKLNIANGANPAAVSTTITQADALIDGLVVPPVGSGFLDPAQVMSLADMLDQYNSGKIGPGSCPDDRDDCLIECPQDIIVNALPGECGTTVPYMCIVPGRCPEGELVCTPPPGSFFPVGTTIVTCQVIHPTDGVMVECSFTVTVRDTEKPSIECPADITAETEPGQCASAVFYRPAVWDNCTSVDLVCTPPSGTVFQSGTTSVTCTARDQAGNETSCTFTVTILDKQAPRITCPPDVEATASGCNTTATAQIGSPTAWDNCDPDPVISAGVRSDGQPLSAPFPLGTTTVTWTATDDSGSSSSCSITVTVHEGTCPQPGECLVHCPDDITTNALPGECGRKVWYDVTLTGQCEGTTVVCTPPPGSFFPIGTTSVTCQVVSLIDTFSHPPVVISDCTFNVTVRDVEPPQITCSPDIWTSADPGECSAVVTYQVAGSDSCSNPVVVVCSPASGSSFPVGTTTVTCTATDAAGNTARCSFKVHVRDNQGPALLCPVDLTVDTSDNSCAVAVDYTTTATDNCSTSGVWITCTPPPGTLFPLGTTPVTCIATDPSGNVTSCTFTVTVRDATPPVINCPADVETTARGCDTSATVPLGPPTAWDNCSTSVTISPGVRSDGQPLSAPFPLGMTTVTWTATDAAGNQARCSTKVTVNAGDCPVPVNCTITCPADIAVDADPQLCGAVVDYQAILNGDCEGTTIVCTPPPGSVFPIGTTLVRCRIIFRDDLTATFGSQPLPGTECCFLVTVRDTEPPQISCPADIAINAEPGQCDAVLNYTVRAWDSCTSTARVTCFPPSGSRFPVGTTTVVCAATDGSGNTSYCTFKVTVHDTTAPQIFCPEDVTVSATGCETSVTVPLGSPTATDDCTSNPIISTGVRSDGLPLSSPFFIGTTIITWTATDASGNTATCATRVKVLAGDCPVPVICPEGPQIVCPSNIVVSPEGGRCDAVVSYDVQVSDDCTSDLQIICTPPPGSRFPAGVTVVTCSVTDETSRTACCSFTVTVLDNVAPQITCPANIAVGAEAGRCDAVVTFEATASDTCSSSVQLSCFPPSGSRFPVGTTTVYCVATDSSGNTAQCTFTVTVRDTQAPTISCPPNITVDAMSGCCDAPVNYTVTASDNCSEIVRVVCTPPPGSTFHVGTTPVVCVATDAAGNTAHCSFTVTVRDRQAPTITCPPDMMVPACDHCCEATVDYVTTASDNCDGDVQIVCVPPPGSTLPLGVTKVVCTATDASGNQTTCSFLIDVCDHTPPTINCPADVTITAPDCADSVQVSLSRPTATDNCSATPLITRGVRSDGRALTDPFPIGTTVITWGTVDEAGNVARCSSHITVLPGQCVPCSIVCPADITVNAEAGRNDAVVTFSPSTSGNCNGVLLSCVPASGSRFPVGTTVVNCTGILPGGGVTQCRFMVTVRDGQAPVLTCPPDIVFTAPQCQSSAQVPVAQPVVTDNSGEITGIAENRSDGRPANDPFPAGTTIVTFTATDRAGNTSSCSLRVTVIPGDCAQPVGGCTHTLGFWKAHPEIWPVDNLNLGSRTYSKAELLAILNQPVAGNRLVRLAHQLIAAKLNVLSGADSTAVNTALAQADALIGALVVPPVGTGNLQAKQTSVVHITLGRFNEGLIGPGPCGD